MISKMISSFCFLLLVSLTSFAWAEQQHPGGDIRFYNASNKTVTAQVSTFGKINLSPKEQKTIKYSSLVQVCSGHTNTCTAKFYVNDNPAGSATINVETGRLVNMKLLMKVQTTNGSQQVLRSVVIE